MLALIVLAVAVEQYDVEKPLARADYEGRSLRELTLMRNMTYAKAHNPFRRESLISTTARANADAIGTYESSLSVDELTKRRDATRAAKPSPERDIELRLLSVRLGGWAG